MTKTLEMELRFKNGKDKVLVPFHIADIELFSNLGEGPEVKVRAIIADTKEWKNWGEALSLLPLK